MYFIPVENSNLSFLFKINHSSNLFLKASWKKRHYILIKTVLYSNVEDTNSIFKLGLCGYGKQHLPSSSDPFSSIVRRGIQQIAPRAIIYFWKQKQKKFYNKKFKCKTNYCLTLRHHMLPVGLNVKKKVLANWMICMYARFSCKKSEG